MIQDIQKPALHPRIFYVGGFRFPDGDAAAHRVYGIGKALRDSGYEVVFLGAESAGRPQDAIPGIGYSFDDFQYQPAGNEGNDLLHRAFRLWHTHLSGLSVMARLKKHWTDSSVAVFAYQASSPLLAQLRCFCHRRNAVLVSDVVEWYDRRHITGGRFGPFALDSEIRMRFVNRLSDGIIAISRYLESYYGRVGIPTLRVPALVNLDTKCWNNLTSKPSCESRIKLAFVGIAGQKDLVVNAIRGIACLGPQARAIELSLVGPSAQELRIALGRESGLLNTLRNSLRFTGRLPHTEALGRLAQADFSIILRPDQRFAHAGFPTKLVESLAMGVPVICNLTSDIGLYVRDGQEGLIVQDSSPEAFADGLKRILGLTFAQRTAMRHHARHRAEQSFDYRNWAEPLGRFMESVLARRGVIK
ncbi:MAG: glycosyltransferase [Formivibrio sp.]|nr:glycosyltransferase [Formivibrio sp.]